MDTQMPSLPEIESLVSAIQQANKVFSKPEITKLKLPPEKSILEKWARRLKDQERHSTQRFTLITLGEVKAGKSTLLNALLDLPKDKRLPVADIPATAKPIRLTYKREGGPEARWLLFNGQSVDKSWDESLPEAVQSTKKHEDIREIILYLASPLLSQADILDMPGTGAGWHEQHTEITREYISNAEAVFWVIGVDEPSREGRRDFNLASEAGVEMIVIFNAWGFLDPSRDKELGINQQEIENSVRDNFPKAFQKHKGFRVYGKKCIESKDRGLEIPPDFGLYSLKEYLINQLLGSFVDKAAKRRANVSRQVQRIADDMWGNLKSARLKWENELLKIGAEGESLKATIASINILEHSIRTDLRKLAGEHADSILNMIRRQVELFIDDKIDVTNIDLYKNMMTKNARKGLEEQLGEELRTKYLHFDEDINWLTEELTDFMEECWTVLQAKWRKFLDDISINPNFQMSDHKIELPFEKLREAAMGGIREIFKRIIAAGMVIGILLAIPGGQIIDAIGAVIALLLSIFTDPFAGSRENAKRRFRNELEMLYSGIKNDLVKEIMLGPHKRLKEEMESQLKDKTEAHKGEGRASKEGVEAIDNLLAAIESVLGETPHVAEGVK